MEELLHYADRVSVDVFKSTGTYNAGVLLKERAQYGEDFIQPLVTDEFKDACKVKGVEVYKLLIKVTTKHGKPEWSTAWRFEPTYKNYYVVFLGNSFSSVINEALQYCKDNTDTSIEPLAYSKDRPDTVIQPLVISTKRYPHYLDDKLDKIVKLLEEPIDESIRGNSW